MVEAAAERWKEFLDTSESGYAEGRCYENAGRFVLQTGEFEGSPLLLCHGEVFSPKHLTRHGHAWVEWGNSVGMVIDPSTGKPEPMIIIRPTYYRLGMIDPATVKRFTMHELLALVTEHHDWGPWE